MMWHGLKNFKWETKLKNFKIYKKFKTRLLNVSLSINSQINQTYNLLYLPPKWQILIFSSSNNLKFYNLAYAYSKQYFFYLPLTYSFGNLYFDNHSRVLQLKLMTKNNFFSTYWTIFKNIFFSFSKFFFKKLKFKGKGYYIYRNLRNTIATQFGYSHMTRIYGYTISLKFLSKTIVFIYGINKHDIFKMSTNLKKKRPYNIFTGKGVRFAKQIIYKKTGKISSYR